MINLTNAQLNFFDVECLNERFGGDAPATLGSALDSLLQAPREVIEEWCDDDCVYDEETCGDFVKSVKNLSKKYGRFKELEELVMEHLDEQGVGNEYRAAKGGVAS